MENQGIHLDIRRARRSRKTGWPGCRKKRRLSLGLVVEELEVSYTILSVALNDAFSTLRSRQAGTGARASAMFSGLFDRLAGRLRGAFRTLEEHGRHFGTPARVDPCGRRLFRSRRGPTDARANQLLASVSSAAGATFSAS